MDNSSDGHFVSGGLKSFVYEWLTSFYSSASGFFFVVVVAELPPVHMYPMKMITVNAFFKNALRVENFGATR